MLAAAALATGLFGLVVSLRKRPVLNRERLRGAACLGLVIAGVTYPIPFPARREGHPSLVEFRLPVRGEWTVVWGGESGDNILAKTRADRRWGLDLLIRRDGKSHARSGNRLGDYFAYDQSVFAPASGRVAMLRDPFPDQVPGAARDPDCDELGNLIVLQVAEAEFVFLCNLMQGSILVGVGEEVELGQELARVGNSSCSPFTPEPHLALHLQDTPVPRWGQAVPWFFNSYYSGSTQVLRGLPSGGPRLSGERVRPVE